MFHTYITQPVMLLCTPRLVIPAILSPNYASFRNSWKSEKTCLGVETGVFTEWCRTWSHQTWYQQTFRKGKQSLKYGNNDNTFNNINSKYQPTSYKSQYQILQYTYNGHIHTAVDNFSYTWHHSNYRPTWFAGSHQLETSEQETDLGVIIDSKLSFDYILLLLSKKPTKSSG